MMFKRIVFTLGSWASLGALGWSFHQPGKSVTWVEGLIIVFFLCFAAVLVFLEIVKYTQKKFFDKADKVSVNNYMYKWISKGDRVAIFSRDMTWAHEPRIKELLVAKARADELSIFLPKQIPLSQELIKQGATVYTYSVLGMDPESRFTIINYGKGDAQVAIGRAYEDKHIIEEYSAGTHPVFHVVMDLIEVLKAMNKGNASTDIVHP